MVSAGGQVPTQMLAPASASALAIAKPKPPSSATPAMNARFPVRSMVSMPAKKLLFAENRQRRALEDFGAVPQAHAEGEADQHQGERGQLESWELERRFEDPAGQR